MIWLLATLACAEILVDGDPAVDAEVTVTILDDLSRPVRGATVRAVHRPGLPGERDLAVGLTDNRGRVYWTPEQGGTTELRTRDDRHVVVVDRGGVPAGHAVLLGLLGVVGLGATVVGLWPARRES